MLTVRAALASDLPHLSRLWHEKMVLHAQSDRRFAMAAGARSHWESVALDWLANPDHAILLAAYNGESVGFIAGNIMPAPPGLLWQRLGIVTELTLDLHRQVGSVGGELLRALRRWFVAQGVENVIACVPHLQPVEQAFWRSQGAAEWVDVMWLKS